MDFLNKHSVRYKQIDDVSFTYGDVIYHIDNVEQYREQIVNAIYQKAKKAADIVAKQEKKKPVIREVRYNQEIKQDILNLTKASLSLSAVIEFEFADK